MPLLKDAERRLKQRSSCGIISLKRVDSQNQRRGSHFLRDSSPKSFLFITLTESEIIRIADEPGQFSMKRPHKVNGIYGDRDTRKD